MRPIKKKQTCKRKLKRKPTTTTTIKQQNKNNIQLLPALKVNIIIVHPYWPRVNNYDVHLKCRQ